MCEGRRFQADGAATEKELFESLQLNRVAFLSVGLSVQCVHCNKTK